MEYISKSPSLPANWDQWFTDINGIRIQDYRAQSCSCRDLKLIRSFLLQEQNGLCAYCQKPLLPDDASIEHLIPKSENVSMSTDYYNLVAVCQSPPDDPENPGHRHCDKERGNCLLPPLILHRTSSSEPQRNHAYFMVQVDGTILPKDNLQPPVKAQVEAFIQILNLNHSLLKAARKSILQPILSGARSAGNNRRAYFNLQFQRVYKDPQHPFRSFILIYLLTKLGYK